MGKWEQTGKPGKREVKKKKKLGESSPTARSIRWGSARKGRDYVVAGTLFSQEKQGELVGIPVGAGSSNYG